MARQVTFLEIINKRTLMEGTDTSTDGTPEPPTVLLEQAQQHERYSSHQ
ncbi:hypothetical protein [Haladaptatus sp. CMAA 1911]